MLDLLKRLRTAPKQTATDLRTALSEIDLDALSKDLDAATARRNGLLLDGSDKELAAAEAAIIAARSTLERVTAVKAQLEPRLAAAEKAEADAALTHERDAVDAEAEAVAVALKTRFPKLQNEMVSILNRLGASNAAVAAMNKKLGAAGRGDERLVSAEWRAREKPQYWLEAAASITSGVVLMSVKDWGTAPYHWRETGRGAFMGAGGGEPNSTAGWPAPRAVVKPTTGMIVPIGQ